MKSLFVAWQDADTRSWHTVGKLTQRGDNEYKFVYTQGAKDAPNFKPFGSLDKLDEVYLSNSLFPIFSNRLLTSNRPEYHLFLDWLNLEQEEIDPFILLALTGEQGSTNNLAIFPCPEKNSDGYYEIKFFAQGIRYLPEGSIEFIKKLVKGDRLYIMHDWQNEFDSDALMLRDKEKSYLVGYVPRYFIKDFHEFRKLEIDIEVTVVKVNSNAPLQFMLLCNAKARWGNKFNACSDIEFLPIPSSERSCSSIASTSE